MIWYENIFIGDERSGARIRKHAGDHQQTVGQPQATIRYSQDEIIVMGMVGVYGLPVPPRRYREENRYERD